MAEVVMRQYRRKKNRWMAEDGRRVQLQQLKRAVGYAARCLPGFLLSMANVLGIPSGLHASLAMAMGTMGRDVRPAVIGGAAAMMIQLFSGVSVHWELLITLGLMLVCPWLLHGRGTGWLMGAAAAAMLPTAITGCMAPTAAEMLRGWAAVLIAGLAAPVFARAVKALSGRKHISGTEERLAVGFLAAACVCGGTRLVVLGINLGVLLSGCATLALALTLGVSAGALAGMLCGVVLSLQGMPLTTAVALSMGGFLAGVANSLSRRRLSCGAFAAGSYLPLLICGSSMGSGAAVLAAALAIGILPRRWAEEMQLFFRRFLNNDPVPGDAYAAAALSAWEKTVEAMARAVPSPRDAQETRNGTWWQERLCQGCPDYEGCGCMATGLGITKAEAVWEYRHAREDVWQDALEHLRGMGCQRLYCLLEGMNVLRREEEAAQRIRRQAEAQRQMLVTHLTAMAGAARRFSALSSGESWWDTMAARRIRTELSERAIPAALSYVRRVQGHAQAAFELQYVTGARKQAEDLCLLASVVLEAPMQLASLDGDRVLIRERPPLCAEVGLSAAPVTGGEHCGDTGWSGELQDGRFLAVLSDGMGHGERAALGSQQTVELTRLCLEAGYSRQQALTAVNGMLLLGGAGERFATADVLTIDLWKGYATLDKLGAAGSWLYQRGELTRMTGDRLPLGILEEIDLGGSRLQLDAGDAVILMTDGIEDAFGQPQVLEAALLSALTCTDPGEAASALMAAALEADEGVRRDDQSVMFVYIRAAKTDFTYG